MRDSGLMLFSQGALTAIATLVMILLARNLSTYQFGLFSSFLGLAQALSFVVDAGLTAWLIRECSRIRISDIARERQDAEIAQLLGHALSIVLYMGIVAVAGSVTLGLALGLSPTLSLAQGAFMGYIAVLAAATSLEAHLRSERRLGLVLGAVLVEKISLLAFVGIVLALGGGLLVLGAVYVLAGLFRVSLDYHRSLRPLGTTPDDTRLLLKPWDISPILKVTAPFAFNSAAMTFLPRLDTAVVATVSVVGAGYYALGYQIVTTAQLVPAIASVTLLPLLTANRRAQGSQWKVFWAMTGIGVVAAAVAILLAPAVVPLLFGNHYRPAIGSIQVMMLAIPPIFASNAIVPFLYNRGHEFDIVRWVLPPSILGTVLVLLGEIAIGPTGASLGLMTRFILITISLVLLSFRRNSARITTIATEPEKEPAHGANPININMKPRMPNLPAGLTRNSRSPRTSDGTKPGTGAFGGVLRMGGTLLLLGALVGSGAAIGTFGSSPSFLFAASVALLASSTVAVIVYCARVQHDAFSVLSLVALFYAAAFAAGGLYYWLNPGPRYEILLNHHTLAFATAMATLAWAILLVGYVLNPLRWVLTIVPRLPRASIRLSPIALITPLLVVGWAARADLYASGRYFHATLTGVAPEATESSWFITALSQLPLLAIAFLGAYRYMSQKRDSRRLRYGYWLMVAIEVAWSLPTGARADLLTVALLVLVVRYYGTGRRVPWRPLILTVGISTFVVFPLVLQYRASKTAYQLTPGAALGSAVQSTFNASPAEFLEHGSESTFERFSDIASLGLIVSSKPQPLSGGPFATLQLVGEDLVPRAIFPNKGNAGLVSEEFARRYELVHGNKGITSIAISQPGELFINFGIPGLIVGMFFIGAAYRVLDGYLIGRRYDIVGLAIYAVVAWPLINGQETIVAAGLVGAIKVMAVLALALMFARTVVSYGSSGAVRSSGNA